jgi:hypothetical protein
MEAAALVLLEHRYLVAMVVVPERKAPAVQAAQVPEVQDLQEPQKTVAMAAAEEHCLREVVAGAQEAQEKPIPVTGIKVAEEEATTVGEEAALPLAEDRAVVAVATAED